MSKVKQSLEKVTPRQAQEYLKHNKRNRRLNPKGIRYKPKRRVDKALLFSLL